MDTPIKKPLGLVVRAEDLALFTKENCTAEYSAESLTALGSIGHLKQAYSPEGLKKLLLDPEYYEQLVEFMSNPKKAKLNIFKIRDLSLAINKNTLIDIFKSMIITSDKPEVQAKNSHQVLVDNPEIRSRIQKLQNMISLDSVVDTMPTYTTSINGQAITLNTKDIVDFIKKCSGSDISFDNTPSIHGLKTKHFLYIVKKFADDIKVHTNFYLSNDEQRFISDIKQDKLADTYSIDEINTTTDPVTPVPLNPELINYVFNNMPKDYTDIQKAIFVYIKLARVFTYDAEFYAEQQSEAANDKHCDINRLSTITPKNNNVVCYEVNQIYAEILKMLGINYDVQYVLGRYGNGHSNLTFKADDFVVHADTVATILGGDMLNTKVNNEISGLTCKNKNAVMTNKFKETLIGVYDDIKKLDPSPYADEDSFDKWRELLTIHILDPEDVTIKDKIDIFTRVAQGNKMPTTEKIAYLTKIYNNLFAKDMNHFKQTYMTIISQQTDKSKLKQPTLVITYNEETPITQIEHNQYVLLDNGTWRDISIEELQALYDKGEIGYISDHIVPGIESKKKETPTI